MTTPHFSSILLIFCIMSCTPSPEAYLVNRTDQPIRISGKGSDKNWEKAQDLSAFHYPWRSEEAPETHFRALWDDSHFYFLFKAIDDEIIVKETGEYARDVINSDRCEIFIKQENAAAPYYSFEMDALGRLFDSEGDFGVKIDGDWECPEEHFSFKSTIEDGHYWVEGKISFEYLRDLKLYKDDHILRMGLYRAEYLTLEDGKEIVKWISWIKPDSPTPQFHIPSSFGILKLN